MEDENWLDQECHEVQRLIDSFSAIKSSLQVVNSYVNKTDETISMSGRVLGHWAQLLHESARITTVLNSAQWTGLSDDIAARRIDELKQIEEERAAQARELEIKRAQEEEQARLDNARILQQQAAETAAALQRPLAKKARLAPSSFARRQTVAVAPRKRESIYGRRVGRQSTMQYL